MPRKTDSRDRFIATAGRLLQERGYGATGLTQIIETSGAPKGSFYFHFPGGKEQLAAEAIAASGELGSTLLRGLASANPDPAAFIRSYAAASADLLERSGFRHGCPVATVTLEMAAESEVIRKASQRALDGWAEVFAEVLCGAGRPVEQARDLARHVLVAMEGALLLARAQRSTAPLTATAEILVSTVLSSRPIG